MSRVCVFDVNETLLDLRALDPLFENIFGDGAERRREWFTQLLLSGMVGTITGVYADFPTIGGAALEMVAARHGVEVVEEERAAILRGMRELPAHGDVRENLERLRAAGRRVVALTNSPGETAEAQLRGAGIRHYFEQVLSADSVRRLKPAPEPYRMAAERLGVAPRDIRLIAAHAWDVAGALRVGCAAAFIARPGAVFDPLVEAPDIVGADLHEVTSRILESEGAEEGG